MRDLHHLEPLIAVDFERRDFLPYSIDQDFAATTGNRAESSFFKSRYHFAQGHPENIAEMLELRGTESVDVNMRIFFADVPQQIDIPVERQFRVMAALHENLDTTGRG